MGETDRKHHLPAGVLSWPASSPEDSGSRVRAKVPSAPADPGAAHLASGRLLLDGLDPEALRSSLAAMVSSLGADATSIVAALLREPQSQVREDAVDICGQVQDPALLQALTPLAIDDSPEVRRGAIRVLRSYAWAPDYARALAQLRFAAADNARPEAKRLRAIAALSRLRDECSVSLLAELLAEPQRGVASAARVGLRIVTGHDFGFAREPWIRWLAKQGQSSREEWLIDGLGDARAHLRALASRELAQLTGLKPPLAENAARTAFVTEQRAYQSWWANRGAPRS